MDHNHQLERLQCITEDEWRKALIELAIYITWKVGGRCQYGAHSESELGMTALDYYKGEAVTKLCSCEWEWKEELSLAEQLKVIAGSKISMQVDHYKRKKKRITSIESLEKVDGLVFFDEENESKEFYEELMSVAQGDEELELYIQAVHDNNSYDDICSDLGFTDKQQVYNLQRKLVRRIKRQQKR